MVHRFFRRRALPEEPYLLYLSIRFRLFVPQGAREAPRDDDEGLNAAVVRCPECDDDGSERWTFMGRARNFRLRILHRLRSDLRDKHQEGCTLLHYFLRMSSTIQSTIGAGKAGRANR